MQTKTNNMAKVAKNQTKKKNTAAKSKRQTVAWAYYQIYRAFLLRNLLSGMTLGAASHNALQLVRAKISTMDKNNSVVKMLLRINARHSKRAAKHIMTSKYRNARMIVKPGQHERVMAAALRVVNSAMAKLNAMMAMYKPKPTPVATKVQPVTMPPNMAMQMQVQQMQLQRA